MIDRHWLQSTICLAGGDLGGKDLDELCEELGVQEEVLPYLLLTARSFSGWPISQAAFRGAAKSVTRPTQMRGASEPRALSPAFRQGMRQSIGAIVTVPPETARDLATAPIATPLQADAGDPKVAPIDIRLRATEDIARFRSAASGPNAEPQSFISNE